MLSFNTKSKLKIEIDGTLIQFPRFDKIAYGIFMNENSFASTKSKEEYNEFIDRCTDKAGELKFSKYNQEEKEQAMKLPARWIVSLSPEVGEMQDEDENPLIYEELDEETKVQFWVMLLETNEFSDWFMKYRASAEKKSIKLVNLH